MGDLDVTCRGGDLLFDGSSPPPGVRLPSGRMPVIVVGADTPVGSSIVDALIEPDREVRAFVTDIDDGARLKSSGVKVAIGDVSDPSHVGGACLNCFSVVFVTEAAEDERERAFASDRHTVLKGWAEAARDAAVTRVIWVDALGGLPDTGIDQTAVVDITSVADVAAEVVRLDDARVI